MVLVKVTIFSSLFSIYFWPKLLCPPHLFVLISTFIFIPFSTFYQHSINSLILFHFFLFSSKYITSLLLCYFLKWLALEGWLFIFDYYFSFIVSPLTMKEDLTAESILFSGKYWGLIPGSWKSYWGKLHTDYYNLASSWTL